MRCPTCKSDESMEREDCYDTTARSMYIVKRRHVGAPAALYTCNNCGAEFLWCRNDGKMVPMQDNDPNPFFAL